MARKPKMTGPMSDGEAEDNDRSFPFMGRKGRRGGKKRRGRKSSRY